MYSDETVAQTPSAKEIKGNSKHSLKTPNALVTSPQCKKMGEIKIKSFPLAHNRETKSLSCTVWERTIEGVAKRWH